MSEQKNLDHAIENLERAIEECPLSQVFYRSIKWYPELYSEPKPHVSQEQWWERKTLKAVDAPDNFQGSYNGKRRNKNNFKYGKKRKV